MSRSQIHIESDLTAKIVEWDDQRGYGFLQSDNSRLFLHRRDFAELHKRPEVGDVIRFTVGSDAKGRPCAQNAVHVNDGGRITLIALAVLLSLLLLPLTAAYRLGLDMRWVSGLLL
jgi:cold shock CspA family protein